MYGFSQSNALSLYGIFTGMALPCILFPSTVTNSAAVMLTPSVAELQALGAHRRIRYIASRACTACFLTGAACMGLFYFFGPFAGELLFHETTAGTCIRTLSFVCPFCIQTSCLQASLTAWGNQAQRCFTMQQEALSAPVCIICNSTDWYTWVSLRIASQ